MSLVPLYLFNRFFYRIFVFLRLHSPTRENFNYLKLLMSAWQRFLVRLISYVIYGLLIVLVGIWIFSEIFWMKTIGIVLAIFLIDRLWWLKKESAASWLIVEYALDRASLFGGDFYLWVAEKAIDHDRVKRLLKNKGIKAADFEKNIKGKLKTTLSLKLSSKELADLANQLLGQDLSLTPDYLFVRLIEKSFDVRILIGNGSTF